MDSAISFWYTYPLDSDSSGGQCYPTFEQPELDVVIVSSNRFRTYLKIFVIIIINCDNKIKIQYCKEEQGREKKNYLHYSTCTNLQKMIFLTTCMISLTEFLTTLLQVQTMTVWRLLSKNNTSRCGSSLVLVWGKLQWWNRHRPKKTLQIIRDVN